MARARRPNGAGGQAATRRITAPIDEALFRAVGAYSKWSGRPLGDVVESALRAYLKGRDFKLAELLDGSDSDAA